MSVVEPLFEPVDLSVPVVPVVLPVEPVLSASVVPVVLPAEPVLSASVVPVVLPIESALPVLVWMTSITYSCIPLWYHITYHEIPCDLALQ